MNKRILLSGVSIVASFTLLAGSAFALFDAHALSTSNTFSAATPGLAINTGGNSGNTTSGESSASISNTTNLSGNNN